MTTDEIPSENQERWRTVARDSRARAHEHRQRLHELHGLVPHRPAGRIDRKSVLTVARETARELRQCDGQAAWRSLFTVGSPTGLAPAPSQRTREISCDYVPVHADVLLRMEMEHEEALSALHSARWMLASIMAEDSTFVRHELERFLQGMANVAAGRVWGDDG